MRAFRFFHRNRYSRINLHKNRLLRNSNTQCLNDQPLKELLQDKLKQDVHIENDANCFALAEATYGAGQDYRVVLGVILGTGCGAGIVVDRKIYNGTNKIAGEFGHHTVSFEKEDCVGAEEGLR